MADYIMLLIKFMGDIIKTMQTMYIVPGVSLFAFLLGALIVVTIVVCVFHN